MAPIPRHARNRPRHDSFVKGIDSSYTRRSTTLSSPTLHRFAWSTSPSQSPPDQTGLCSRTSCSLRPAIRLREPCEIAGHEAAVETNMERDVEFLLFSENPSIIPFWFARLRCANQQKDARVVSWIDRRCPSRFFDMPATLADGLAGFFTFTRDGQLADQRASTDTTDPGAGSG